MNSHLCISRPSTELSSQLGLIASPTQFKRTKYFRDKNASSNLVLIFEPSFASDIDLLDYHKLRSHFYQVIMVNH